MATAVADKELRERGEQLKRDGIVIRTYDLWKTYIMGDQEINAVSGVDVTIKRGEYVAIMGPSGSGKSTLMNLIGCLDTPSKGLYYINGSLVSEMSDDELARIRNKEIGFVFPDLQPAAARHISAQRRAAADLRRHPRRCAHGKGQERTAPGGPGSPHVPQTQRAFGRPAPTCGGSAGTGEQPFDSAGG